ncbi:putative glutamate--cysteine ligase 2-3 [Actinoplanes siamensis]|uniref:Putative glutamate--cysteine ligase 2 n=1 Tax=Actinoplanes siamensis TaxID=1223317 RepID=A0A919TN37_9ACTN|nr:putative glutamate--cysteine ligase 2-3 [Actinoplanes siamensis]
MLTLGVEEEFLLLDPVTGCNVPVAAQVLDALPPWARGQGRLELRRSMLELVTGICTGLDDLRRELTGLRRAATETATRFGARLVAIGATPVGEQSPTVADKPRYRAIARQYGPIAEDEACCGCHVHVGVADHGLAVQVCNQVRVWLPVLQALAANSPFYAGADTGYASWRCAQLQRWPSVGPTPYFDTPDEYDRTVDTLIATGVILDRAMVYWYARPSARYPTVEIRVADVCLTVADTVLVAALARALVAAAVERVVVGDAAPRVRDCLLTAAHWHAAHEGLRGTLIDPRSGAACPAWDLVEELFGLVAPALERHRDRLRTQAGLIRLRHQGTGADRQRRMLGQAAGLPEFLGELAAQTAGGASGPAAPAGGDESQPVAPCGVTRGG